MSDERKVRPTHDEHNEDQDSGQLEQAQKPAENHITVNENGGVFVFGEPLSADSLTIGSNGERVYVETDNEQSQLLLEAVKDLLRSDIANGKKWEDFGGFVVNPQVLKHLINLGIISKEQVLAAIADSQKEKLTTTFSAQPFFEVFEGGIEPLISADHPFYSRKLIIMTPSAIQTTYGHDYKLLTIDKEENIL